MRLGELAERLAADLEGDPELTVERLAPIDEAGPGDLTFAANPKYKSLLVSCRATAVIVDRSVPLDGPAALRVDEPYAAFVSALALFDTRPGATPGIHPTAMLAPGAQCGPGASIGAYAVVGEGAVLGCDATIHPHAVIYPGVRIGDRFVAHAGSVVRENCVLGDDVVLQPGAVVGGDGFGFLPLGGGRSLPIPQIGNVEVGDGVDIGANTTVDRAAVGSTRLGDGVKLDNLVMVAHGSRIGRGAMLAGQAGMAGSTTIGDGVVVGGQAGFAGHLEVGAGSQIAARCGVISDVAPGTVAAGFPHAEMGQWRRVAAALTRLPELFRRVRALEKRLDKPRP